MNPDDAASSDEAKPAARPVIIVGGGVGGVSAALALSEAGSVQGAPADQEIRLYQMGWRLGGKAASGRSLHPGFGSRIEEHGLHVWFGSYHHTFRVLDNMLEAIRNSPDRSSDGGQRPDLPTEEWFEPTDVIGSMELHRGQWKLWLAEFPPDEDEHARPWDEDHERFTISRLLRHSLRLAERYLRSISADISPDVGPIRIRADIERSGIGVTGWTRRWLGRLAPGGEALLLPAALELVDELVAAPEFGSDLLAADSSLRKVLSTMLARLRDWLQSEVNDAIRASDSHRRAWYFVDVLVAVAHGIVVDGLLDRPGGLDVIDDLDFREWLIKNGCSKEAAGNAVITAAVYDLAFGYVDGDPDQPSVGAGTALRGLAKLLFFYRGHVMWKMKTSMADLLFSPAYRVLTSGEDRWETERYQVPVDFHFCHRLDHVYVAPPDKHVQSVPELQDLARGGEAMASLIDADWRVVALEFSLQHPSRASDSEPCEVQPLMGDTDWSSVCGSWPSFPMWRDANGDGVSPCWGLDASGLVTETDDIWPPEVQANVFESQWPRFPRKHLLVVDPQRWAKRQAGVYVNDPRPVQPVPMWDDWQDLGSDGREVNVSFDRNAVEWRRTPVAAERTETWRLSVEVIGDVDCSDSWHEGAEVVMAVPLGVLPYVASELIDNCVNWRNMVESLETVQTQAAQLWAGRSTEDLLAEEHREQAEAMRVGSAGLIVGGFVEPFDTWSDMSLTRASESWPADFVDGSIAYFCNVLTGRTSGHAADPVLRLPPQEARERFLHGLVRQWDAFRNALRFMRRDLHEIWGPGLKRYPRRLDLPWILGWEDQRRWDLDGRMAQFLAEAEVAAGAGRSIPSLGPTAALITGAELMGSAVDVLLQAERTLHPLRGGTGGAGLDRRLSPVSVRDRVVAQLDAFPHLEHQPQLAERLAASVDSLEAWETQRFAIADRIEAVNDEIQSLATTLALANTPPEEFVPTTPMEFLRRRRPELDEADQQGVFDFARRFYSQANVEPSSLYVQSVPGSVGARLLPGDSGVRNVALAGDWTRCGINAGYAEGAVLSGLAAAAAVVGRMRKDALEAELRSDTPLALRRSAAEWRERMDDLRLDPGEEHLDGVLSI
ncbi:MAG: NAD(P)-binding protein [Actinomycetota bacterium]